MGKSGQRPADDGRFERRLCAVAIVLVLAVGAGYFALRVAAGGSVDHPPPGWLNEINGSRLSRDPYYSARQLTSALDQCFIESGETIAFHDEIFGPSQYIKSPPAGGDWSETFPFRQGDGRLVCRMPDGNRYFLLVDSHGSDYLVRDPAGKIIYQRRPLNPRQRAVLDGRPADPDAPADGVWVDTYGYGQRRWEENLAAGRRDGPFAAFAEDGSLAELSSYRDGLPDGTMWFFDGAGQIRRVVDFSAGRVVRDERDAGRLAAATTPPPARAAAAGRSLGGIAVTRSTPAFPGPRRNLREAEEPAAREDFAAAEALLGSAITEVQAALRRERRDPEALVLLGRLHLAMIIEGRWFPPLEAGVGRALQRVSSNPKAGPTALDIDAYSAWRATPKDRWASVHHKRAMAARSLALEALELSPENREALRLLADAGLARSRIESSGRAGSGFDGARWGYEAFGAASGRADQSPGDGEARAAVTRCRHQLARVQLEALAKLGYDDATTAPVRATLDTLEAELIDDPLGKAEVGLFRGRLEAKVGRTEAAEAAFEGVVKELGEELAPNDIERRWLGFQALFAAGNLHTGERADAYYQRAIAAAGVPSDLASARGRERLYYLGFCHLRSGYVLRQTEPPERSATSFRRSTERFQELHRRAPGSAAYLYALRESLYARGLQHLRHKQWEEARKAFAEEADVLRAAAAKKPRFPSGTRREIDHRLGHALEQQAEAEIGRGRNDEAAALLTEALEHFKETRYWRDVAKTHQRFARAASANGDGAAAVGFLEKAVEQWKRNLSMRSTAKVRRDNALDLARANDLLAAALATAHGADDPRVAEARQAALDALDALDAMEGVPSNMAEQAAALRARLEEVSPLP